MKVGRRIKAFREARGLTRAQLAARAKLSRVHVARLERDEGGSPTLDTLERIAKALAVSLHQIINGRGGRK